MSERLELFPYTLIRISGGSMDKLSSLNAIETSRLLNTIFEVREKIDTIKNRINDALYEHIAGQKDVSIQKLLLSIKRDIFNEREIELPRISEVKSNLTGEIAAGIENYLSFQTQYHALRKQGEIIFNKERIEVHENFKKLSKNELFQKGLLLSSKTLLDRIEHYQQTNPALMRKKEAQTEQGLLKYITRMHSKTSPFSTFTNLATGRIKAFDENNSSLLKTVNSVEQKVVSHIRLSNFLFRYLYTLLIKNRNIYLWLLLHPNPTIQNKGDHFLYLTNNDNKEAFQRLPFNPVVELLLELTTQNKEGVVFNELINTIIKEDCIDASPEELEAYLKELIDYGFFEFNLGISGIDTEWDKKLIKKLQPISSNYVLIPEIIESLQGMRMMAEKYGEASVQDRKRILGDTFTLFRAICMKMHEGAGLPADERRPMEEQEKEQIKKAGEEKVKAERKMKEEKDEKGEIEFKHNSSTLFYFTPQQLFLEDSSRDAGFYLNQDALKKFTQKVDELIAAMALFEGSFDDCQLMKHFFIQKYGMGKQIDLLTFYEDYFRDVKKPEVDYYKEKNKKNFKIIEEYKEKEKQAGTDQQEIQRLKKELKARTQIPPPELFKAPLVEERSKIFENWYIYLEEEIRRMNETSKQDAIHLKMGPIHKANERSDLSKVDTNTKGSYSMFVQMYEEKQQDGKVKLMGVLNISTVGYGKWVSRFLHILDNSFTEELRKWNASQQGANEIFIEDSDASYFNANLHPPLMPFEVRIPNGHNSLPVEQQIPITDLLVTCNEQKKNLSLLQKSTGKEIFIFDLGFQSAKTRSQLFQLLDKFSKAKLLSWHPILNVAYPEPATKAPIEQKQKKEILIKPRIVVEGQIVLQRKAWYIPKELLPLRKNTESDWDYFERINIWRRQQQIPDEVFIFLFSQNQRTEIEDAKPLRADDYKPQYINFTSPHLVNLWEKSLLKVPVALRVEEMLPNTEQLLKFGNEKHVTEFIMQWYKYDN